MFTRQASWQSVVCPADLFFFFFFFFRRMLFVQAFISDGGKNGILFGLPLTAAFSSSSLQVC